MHFFGLLACWYLLDEKPWHYKKKIELNWILYTPSEQPEKMLYHLHHPLALLHAQLQLHNCFWILTKQQSMQATMDNNYTSTHASTHTSSQASTQNSTQARTQGTHIFYISRGCGSNVKRNLVTNLKAANKTGLNCICVIIYILYYKTENWWLQSKSFNWLIKT